MSSEVCTKPYMCCTLHRNMIQGDDKMAYTLPKTLPMSAAWGHMLTASDFILLVLATVVVRHCIANNTFGRITYPGCLILLCG